MKAMAEYLDRVKEKAGIKNDYNLSIKIGLTAEAIRRIRNGIFIPSDETCIKLARLAGDDPEKIILIAHATRAESKEATKIWNGILKKAIRFSVITLLLWSTLPDFTPTDSPLYIMRQPVFFVICLIIHKK